MVGKARGGVPIVEWSGATSLRCIQKANKYRLIYKNVANEEIFFYLVLILIYLVDIWMVTSTGMTYSDYVEKQNRLFMKTGHDYEILMFQAMSSRNYVVASNVFLEAEKKQQHGLELIYLAAIYSGLYIFSDVPESERIALIDKEKALKYLQLADKYYPDNISVRFIDFYWNGSKQEQIDKLLSVDYQPTGKLIARLLEGAASEELDFRYYSAQTANWPSLDFSVLSVAAPFFSKTAQCGNVEKIKLFSPGRPINYLPSLVDVDEINYSVIDFRFQRFLKKCNKNFVNYNYRKKILDDAKKFKFIGNEQGGFLNSGQENAVVERDAQYLREVN